MLDQKLKAKIALFCNVEENAVITARDVDCIYELPLVFHDEGLDERIAERLNMWTGTPKLSRWKKIVSVAKNPKERVRIAVVGKYVDVVDSYKSLNEALTHGGLANECAVELEYVDSEGLETQGFGRVREADGVLVPAGFGQRGTEGKIAAVRYARESQVPFFGICFGMQMAAIEFARHVCGLERANSAEVDPETPHAVIDLMTTQKGLAQKGGTMRLGAYACVLADGSVAAKLYGKKKISERHRHRFEFNNAYRETIESHGMRLSGLSPDGSLVEVVEISDHPWFIGCQFHPEFKSKPLDCHPLFRGFIRAALVRRSAARDTLPLGNLRAARS
jgi:CTP synthase